VTAFLELTKPRITQFVLLTAAAGFYVAATAGGGTVDLALFAHTLVGTALVAAGTNAFNQLRERDVDARMERTRRRPLPSGRVTPRAAAWFATAIAGAGLAYLAVLVNPLTTSLAALTLVSYVALYTPLKRRSSLNTLVGAVPGALPIVGGWTAAGGSLDAAAAALFWILFLWQLPHFLALAWIYRDDYRRGGLVMLSGDDPDGRRTARMVLLYALALVPVSLVPRQLGLAGNVYFVGALALGLVYAGAGAVMTLGPTGGRAWRVFVTSIVYLPALLALMVLDRRPT